MAERVTDPNRGRIVNENERENDGHRTRLAVVPVSDLERADTWYEALFGRPADNRPMPSLVEWQVTGAGWVQIGNFRVRYSA